jgi:hypothetical protein
MRDCSNLTIFNNFIRNIIIMRIATMGIFATYALAFSCTRDTSLKAFTVAFLAMRIFTITPSSMRIMAV